MKSVITRSNVYIGLILAAGLGALASGVVAWHSDDLTRCIVYCAIAVVASGMKVSLPGVTGTMSMNFVFNLIGIAELSRPEALLLSALGVVVQCTLHARRRPKPVQVLFSVASIALAMAPSYDFYHGTLLHSGALEIPLRLSLTAAILFLVNTFSIAVVIALTEHKDVFNVWKASYLWSFPNYFVGAAVAYLITITSRMLGWQSALMILPVLYLLFRWHGLYVSRVEEAKRRSDDQRVHAEEVASLHWRTIEVLALAIECKDQTTHDHLERVQVYALEVGKELGLTESELEALRAASLLHDIGKMAVPEYIISKPGKLTPDEFGKMKIHPVVGAEILEQVQFPYPVAPIVRYHHEKWDGNGYPDGLSGVNIPIGARILAAVDCLDALASDRQYRRALPLDEAIKIIQKDAGKAFDPRVVDVLVRRYVELEQKAKSTHTIAKPKLSLGITVDRGAAPAAGFEQSAGTTPADLANMQKALKTCLPLKNGLGQFVEHFDRCATPQDALHHLRTRLREHIVYDAMALYRKQGEQLVPHCVDGDAYQGFTSAEIPLGQGLSGWVGENGKPILNGNPAVEPGFLNDPARFSELRSALAVPLEAEHGVIGVLSLYRQDRDAYTAEQLEVLQQLGTRLSRALNR